MSKILCIIFCFILNHSLLGQADFNSARISTMVGSHLTFNFNSISEFSSGITKTNHTILGLSFSDLSGGVSVSGWKITVKAPPPNVDFQGSGGINTLELNVLEIQATNAGVAVLPAGDFKGWKELSNAEQNLVEHTTTEDRFSTSTQVNISYRCGVTNKIFGSNSDYYEAELELWLRPVP